jgi:uncharacterized protein YxjI
MFVVLDELLNEKYLVTGSKDNIAVKDLQGNSLLKIKHTPLPAVKAYSIKDGKSSMRFFIGSTRTTVNCYFSGIGWHIRGNVFTKSFDIIDADNSLVATHSKAFGKCIDGYGLNVINEDRELFCIAVAICVNLGARLDNPQIQPV